MKYLYARWKASLSLRKAIKHFLSAIGMLWLLIEFSAFFSRNEWVFPKWWFILPSAFIYTVIAVWPRKSFKYKLSGRDTLISIRIDDAFKVAGALVVPINSEFDNNIVDQTNQARSIQEQFINQFYGDARAQLNIEIQAKLNESYFDYKLFDKLDGQIAREFEIGTVIQLRRKNRLFYLLANSKINLSGQARGTVNDLKTALASLWFYLSDSGDLGDIVIPLLGTGYARLPIKREEVGHEIIRSFIASCSTRKTCDHLIIVIHPMDVLRYNINIPELDRFLKHSCKYAEFDHQSLDGLGEEVEVNRVNKAYSR